jgi:hypothetical protein
MLRLPAPAPASEAFYLGIRTLKNQNCLACREHVPRFLCYIFIYPRFAASLRTNPNNSEYIASLLAGSDKVSDREAHENGERREKGRLFSRFSPVSRRSWSRLLRYVNTLLSRLPKRGCVLPGWLPSAAVSRVSSREG